MSDPPNVPIVPPEEAVDRVNPVNIIFTDPDQQAVEDTDQNVLDAAEEFLDTPNINLLGEVAEDLAERLERIAAAADLNANVERVAADQENLQGVPVVDDQAGADQPAGAAAQVGGASVDDTPRGTGAIPKRFVKPKVKRVRQPAAKEFVPRVFAHRTRRQNRLAGIAEEENPAFPDLGVLLASAPVIEVTEQTTGGEVVSTTPLSAEILDALLEAVESGDLGEEVTQDPAVQVIQGEIPSVDFDWANIDSVYRDYLNETSELYIPTRPRNLLGEFQTEEVDQDDDNDNWVDAESGDDSLDFAGFGSQQVDGRYRPVYANNAAMALPPTGTPDNTGNVTPNVNISVPPWLFQRMNESLARRSQRLLGGGVPGGQPIGGAGTPNVASTGATAQTHQTPQNTAQNAGGAVGGVGANTPFATPTGIDPGDAAALAAAQLQAQLEADQRLKDQLRKVLQSGGAQRPATAAGAATAGTNADNVPMDVVADLVLGMQDEVTKIQDNYRRDMRKFQMDMLKLIPAPAANQSVAGQSTLGTTQQFGNLSAVAQPGKPAGAGLLSSTTKTGSGSAYTNQLTGGGTQPGKLPYSLGTLGTHKDVKRSFVLEDEELIMSKLNMEKAGFKYGFNVSDHYRSNADVAVGAAVVGDTRKNVFTSNNPLEEIVINLQAGMMALSEEDPVKRRQARADLMARLDIDVTRESIRKYEQRVQLMARHADAVAVSTDARDDKLRYEKPCPALGTKIPGGKIKLDFQRTLGNQFFTGRKNKDKHDKREQIPARTLYDTTYNFIEEYELSSTGAFHLLRGVLRGDALNLLESQEASGISFQSFWKTMQALFGRSIDVTKIQYELEKVRNTVPTDMLATVAKLSKLHEEANFDLEGAPKALKVSTGVVNDLEKILKRYFPYIVDNILERVEKIKGAYERERTALVMANLPLTNITIAYHPVDTLIKIMMAKLDECPPIVPKKHHHEHHVNAVEGVAQVDAGKGGHNPYRNSAGSGGGNGSRGKGNSARGGGGKAKANIAFVATRKPLQSWEKGFRSNRGRGGHAGRGGAPMKAIGYQAAAAKPWTPRRGGGFSSRGFQQGRGGPSRGFGNRNDSNRVPLGRAPNGRYQPGLIKAPARGTPLTNADGSPLICHACNKPNHKWNTCYKYKDEGPPANARCNTCQGRHNGPCQANTTRSGPRADRRA